MIPAQIATPTYAALLDRGIWAQTADPFTYVAEFLPLAALAVGNFDNNIQNDSDFLLVTVSARVTSADNAADVAFYPALITWLDQGAGRTLQSRAEHFQNVAGTAELPYYLPVPKLIDRGSTFTTQLTSLDAVNARNIRISYHGFKLFGRRPSASEVAGAESQRAAALLGQLAAYLKGGGA